MMSLRKHLPLAAVAAIAFYITACSQGESPDASASGEGSAALQPFPPMPGGTAKSVQVTGKVTDWMFEGDGGCFGALTDDSTTIDVYSEANLCENVNAANGVILKVDIIYEADKQHDIGDGKKPAYTIVKFHN